MLDALDFARADLYIDSLAQAYYNRKEYDCYLEIFQRKHDLYFQQGQFIELPDFISEVEDSIRSLQSGLLDLFEHSVYLHSFKANNLKIKGYYREALPAYRQVIDSIHRYKKWITNPSTLVAHKLNDIAEVYKQTGQHEQAIRHLSQAIDSIRKDRQLVEVGRIGRNMRIIAECFSYMGKWDQSKTYYAKAEEELLLSLSICPDSMKDHVYFELAGLRLSKLRLAIVEDDHAVAEKAIAEVFQEYGYYVDTLNGAYFELLLILNENDNVSQNYLQLLRRYERHAKKAYGLESVHYARASVLLAEYHLKLDQLEYADDFLKRSEHILTSSDKTFTSYQSPLDLVHWAQLKNQYLHEMDDLQGLGLSLTAGIDMISDYIYSVQNADRQFFIQQAYHFIDEALEYTEALNDGTLIVRLMELVRSLSTLEALKDGYYYKSNTIDDKTLEKEAMLRSAMMHTYEKWQEQIGSGDEEKIGHQLEAIHRRTVEQYDSIKFKLEPHRQNSKAESERLFTLHEIQANLDNESCILEYFVGPENTYVLVINEDEYALKRLVHTGQIQDLIQRIATYRNGSIRTSERSLAQVDKTWNNFVDVSIDGYEELIGPVEVFLREKIMIVPDGVLFNLPFASLVVGRKKDGSPTYLLEKHTIHHQYSIAVSQELKNKVYNYRNHRILAVAPDFGEGVEQSDLIASRRGVEYGKIQNIEEVRRICKKWNVKTLIGGKATTKNFLKHSKDAFIIHLPTHAQSNEKGLDSSYILLASALPNRFEKLTLREIMTSRIKSELVYLNACETGLGELFTGEGVRSLGLAFIQAGSKSLITTMWEIMDNSASIISQRFYHHLSEGKPKNEALRLAQLELINGDDGFSHPYHWAAYTAMGDMSPLEIEKRKVNGILFVLPLILILALGLHLQRRRLRNEAAWSNTN